jgi:hypothetical protein
VIGRRRRGVAGALLRAAVMNAPPVKMVCL